MNCWRLEKNRVIAIKKRKYNIISCLVSCCSAFLLKSRQEAKSQLIIQLKILINQTKFNKILVFYKIKGVCFNIFYKYVLLTEMNIRKIAFLKNSRKVFRPIY